MALCFRPVDADRPLVSPQSLMAAERRRIHSTGRPEHDRREHQEGIGAGLPHQPTSRARLQDMTFETAYEMLSEWQTLISAVLALIAALLTAREMRKQTRGDGTLHKNELLRKRLAARAQMPDALSEVSEYVDKSCGYLVSGAAQPEAPSRRPARSRRLCEHAPNDDPCLSAVGRFKDHPRRRGRPVYLPVVAGVRPRQARGIEIPLRHPHILISTELTPRRPSSTLLRRQVDQNGRRIRLEDHGADR